MTPACNFRAGFAAAAVLIIVMRSLAQGAVPPPAGEEASYEWYRRQHPDPVIFTPIGPPSDPAETGVSPRGQLMMGKLAYSEEDGTLGGTPYVAGSLAFGLVEGSLFITVGTGEPARQSLLEGCLPIVITTWKSGDVEVRQTAFSRPLRGDDYVTGLEATLAWAVFEISVTGGGEREIAFAASLIGDEKNLRRPVEFRDGVLFENDSALIAARLPEGFRVEFVPVLGGKPEVQGIELLRNGGAYNALVVRGRCGPTRPIRLAFARVFQFPGMRHWGPSPVKVAPEELQSRVPDRDLEAARATWQRMAQRLVKFQTPDTTLDRIVTKGMLDGYYLTKRWNGNWIVFDSVCYRCQWDDASTKWFYALDLMGDHEMSRRLLKTVFARQGQRRPKGASSSEGCFSDVTNIVRDGSDAAWASCNGWALWSMAQHARLTDDRQWLMDHKKQILDGCGWIIRERRRSQQDPANPCAGLIHGKFVCDMPDDGPVKGVGYFTYTDAISYMGLRDIAALLRDWGHAEGAGLADEAEQYRRDIVAAVDRATDRRRDPWFVPWALHAPRVEHKYLNGVCGPINLAYAGVMRREEPIIAHAIRWNIEHDNGGSVEQSAISNMFYSQDLAITLLESGRVEEFLRMFYCILGANVTHQTLATCEWRRNTQPHVHSIASLVRMYRTLMIQEREGGLYLLQGTPRRWLQQGGRIRIAGAPTLYGPLSLECDSAVEQGRVSLQLEFPPRLGATPVHLRLRLPLGLRLDQVNVNGRSQPAEGEWIVLRNPERVVRIEAKVASDKKAR